MVVMPSSKEQEGKEAVLREDWGSERANGCETRD